MRFKDKVVIVTGAGRGIGKSIALAFIKEGAKVVLNDIARELLTGVSNEIGPDKKNTLIADYDISIKNKVEHMMVETIEKFKKVDVLVNNAGIAKYRLITETEEKEWDAIFNVNLKGTFLCSQAVAKEMIKRRTGRVINIASNAARIPRIQLGAYCASKAAVVQFTRVLALELAEYGITVNAVCPGATNTELLKTLPTNIHEQIHGNLTKFRCGIPLGKLADPDDIMSMVLYLASESGKHITGEAIYIDGGQSIV